MTEHALVTAEGEILRYGLFDETPTLAPNKPQWLPIVETKPDFDPVTQALDGPVITIGSTQVTRVYTVRAKNSDELAAMRAEKLDAISQQYATLCDLPITFSVGGVSKVWDADANAIGNISGIVLLIAAGASVADPRPWTAHGEMTATNMTHAELIGLGGAIAARKDALFVKKKTKEYQVSQLTTAADIAAFDPLADWSI